MENDGWVVPKPPTGNVLDKPARKPRTKKKTVVKPDTLQSRLIEALTHIVVCQRAKGNDTQTHCFAGNGKLIAFDGIIAAGIDFPLDVFAAPHTLSLIAALAFCADDMVLTQLNAERLMVRSGDFSTVIPCVAPSSLSAAFPDARIATVDERLRAAFMTVAPLVSDRAEHVTTACVRLGPQYVVGTDGAVILEVFHGIDLPPGLLVPKAALTAIKKIKRPLTGLGFSRQTVTFYFEGADNAWIRTQIYNERYADVESILKQHKRIDPIPFGFFNAVARAAKFSPDGNVYCGQGMISSHDPTDQATGSEQLIQVPGVTATRIYNAKAVATMERFSDWIDDQSRVDTTYFGTSPDAMLLRNPKEKFPVWVRGAIEHNTVKPATVAQTLTLPTPPLAYRTPTDHVQVSDMVANEAQRRCMSCGLFISPKSGSLNLCDCIPF